MMHGPKAGGLCAGGISPRRSIRTSGFPLAASVERQVSCTDGAHLEVNLPPIPADFRARERLWNKAWRWNGPDFRLNGRFVKRYMKHDIRLKRSDNRRWSRKNIPLRIFPIVPGRLNGTQSRFDHNTGESAYGEHSGCRR
jgi:hypothetical protein